MKHILEKLTIKYSGMYFATIRFSESHDVMIVRCRTLTHTSFWHDRIRYPGRDMMIAILNNSRKNHFLRERKLHKIHHTTRWRRHLYWLATYWS